MLKRVAEHDELRRKLREEIEQQQERLDSATGRGVGPDLTANVSREAAKLLAKTAELLTEGMSEAAGLVSAALNRSTDAADQSSRAALHWQIVAIAMTFLIMGTMVATSPWCAPPSTIVVPVESPPDSPPDTPLPVTRLGSSAR